MDAQDDISRVGWRNLMAGGRCIHLFDGILRLFEVNMGFSSVQNDAVSRGASALYSNTRRFQSDANSTNHFRGIPFEAGYFFRLDEMEFNLGEVFGIREDASFLWSAGAYADVSARFGDHLLLQPGLVFLVTEPVGIEPRLRGSWRPFGSEDQELSGALGFYRQAVAGMTDTRDASAVFVAWGLVPDATATTSLHAQLAWQQRLASGLNGSVEGYFRRIEDIAVPLWDVTAEFNTQLALANGRVFGADARLEYVRPSLYGFLGYGFSWTEYSAAQDHFNFWFDEPVQRYHPPHDRRHQVSAMVSVDAGPYTVGARWQLGTGLPFTRPMGYDETFDYRMTIPSIRGNRGQTRMIVEKPYQARLPIMHRLDVSLERVFPLPFGALKAQAGAINVYDRRNMFYYDLYTHRRIDQLPLAPYASLRLEVR